MKSEKAEAILSRACETAELCEPKESVVPFLDACSAVEQAESDRDAKAVEAYKQNCRIYTPYCFDKKPCTADCEYLSDFIQNQEARGAEWDKGLLTCGAVVIVMIGTIMMAATVLSDSNAETKEKLIGCGIGLIFIIAFSLTMLIPMWGIDPDLLELEKALQF